MNLRFLGTLLVVCGLGLAAGPTLAVRIYDALEARGREAEVGRWLQERSHPSAGGPAMSSAQHGAGTVASPSEEPAPEAPPATAGAPDVIEPGLDGYLLEIPKLGMRAVVRELEPEVFSGKNTPLLKRFGLGQVPYSPALRNVAPGAEGTAVIAGHRTTSGAPFRYLDRLGPGDVIVIRKADARQRWRVVYATVVAPHEVDAITSEPGTRRLALLACSPPFSDARRLIVYAAQDTGEP